MINFGTDGWRALIAQDYTFANVAKCAQGVAEYINRHDNLPKSVVVGFDTRFLSDKFASTVRQVLINNDIKVFWIDSPTPTPVVTYMITHFEAGGGIIITASHNPYDWNGFKFKSHHGGSASQAVVEEIELYANSVAPATDDLGANKNDLVELIPARTLYMEHVARIVDLPAIKRANLNIILDCMFGSGINYLPEILSPGSTEVTQISEQINPNFPTINQPEPIEANLSELISVVASDEDVDIGLAFDGDADRIGVTDETGRYISTLDTFSLLAYYFLAYKKQKEPIVKSITHSDMINKLCEEYDVELYETAVGFKNLGPKMMETGAMLAGEESGGFAFKDSVPERDGILSALYLVEFVATSGKRFSELLTELYNVVGPHFYSRFDIPLTNTEIDRIKSLVPTDILTEESPIPIRQVNTTDGVKLIGEEGWVAYRLSGTEPLLRIYSEASTQEIVDVLIKYVRSFLGVS